MIKVVRPQAPAAIAALNKPCRNGLSERDWANWWYGNTAPTLPVVPAKPKRPPNFTRYKDKAVRAAIEAMFNHKCGYCESPYSHSDAIHIEHYRPKGAWCGDDGKLVRPGYYWLAAEWENLLAACGHCNCHRNQVRRLADGRLVKDKAGKSNFFPLAPGSPRATNDNELALEIPLLLNPCIDDPDLHLRFGYYGFVEPAPTPEEAALPKGDATILTCGLDRHLLVERRAKEAAKYRGQLVGICAADLNLAEAPTSARFLAQRAAAEQAANAFVQHADFIAAIRALRDVFEAVRVHARAYCDAVGVLTADPADAAAEQQLRAAIAAILGVLEDDTLNADFIKELLPHWGIELA